MGTPKDQDYFVWCGLVEEYLVVSSVKSEADIASVDLIMLVKWSHDYFLEIANTITCRAGRPHRREGSVTPLMIFGVTGHLSTITQPATSNLAERDQTMSA